MYILIHRMRIDVYIYIYIYIVQGGRVPLCYGGVIGAFGGRICGSRLWLNLRLVVAWILAVGPDQVSPNQARPGAPLGPPTYMYVCVYIYIII